MFVCMCAVGTFLHVCVYVSVCAYVCMCVCVHALVHAYVHGRRHERWRGCEYWCVWGCEGGCVCAHLNLSPIHIYIISLRWVCLFQLLAFTSSLVNDVATKHGKSGRQRIFQLATLCASFVDEHINEWLQKEGGWV